MIELCLTCADGHYFIADNTCTQCNGVSNGDWDYEDEQLCNSCTDSKTCHGCVEHYYVDITEEYPSCKRCSDECKDCDGEPTKCTSCAAGHYFSADFTCTPCRNTEDENDTEPCVECSPAGV